jgi:hypothetical protein
MTWLNKNIIYVNIVMLLVINGCLQKEESYYFELYRILASNNGDGLEEEIESAKANFSEIGEGDSEALPALLLLMREEEWKSDAMSWSARIGTDATSFYCRVLRGENDIDKFNILILFFRRTVDVNWEKITPILMDLINHDDMRIALLSQRILWSKKGVSNKYRVSDDIYIEAAFSGDTLLERLCFGAIHDLNKKKINTSNPGENARKRKAA